MKSLIITLIGLLAFTESFAQDPLNCPSSPSAPSAPAGIPVMWVDRGPIENLDLFWGGSSAERAPGEILIFNKNKETGTSPGLKLVDVQCIKWSGKFNGSKGQEVHAEIAATRLAWAVGFNVEESYLRDHGRVEFSTSAPKSGEVDRRYSALNPEVQSFIDKNGQYKQPMRLERNDPDAIDYDQTWFYNSNPIKNNPATAKYFSAQAIFNNLIANWDLGKSVEKTNNKILGVKNAQGQLEDWYIVSDYGATFGQMGKRSGFKRNHSKYDLRDYNFKSKGGKNDPPVNYIEGQTVYMNTEGEIISGHIAALQQIPLAHAQWFAERIAPLKVEQIEQAFRAAGATQTEMTGFSRILKARIDQFVGCVRNPESCRTPTGR